MSKLLFDKKPLVLSTELAISIGLNEAIILQQVHYWLENNKESNRNFYENKYWTYNSIQKWWEESFQFWTLKTVERTFKALEDKGLLIVGNYNKDRRDRTKWYSINYELLADFGKCIPTKCRNANVQNVVMHSDKLSEPLPESTTESTTDIINSSSQLDEGSPPDNTPKVFDLEGIEYKSSKFLADKILDVNPKAKVPKTPEELFKWCIHIERLLRIDERPPDELRQVLMFAVKDEFWRSNILSTQKLRVQYDQLFMKMQQQCTNKSNKPKQNKFNNFDGRKWDFEELEKLERENIDQNMKDDDYERMMADFRESKKSGD